jgi:hypothetical protein
MSDAALIVKYKHFKRTFATWDQMFVEAAEFATHIGRERLIGISHSQTHNEGVVAVWYWAEPGNADA